MRKELGPESAPAIRSRELVKSFAGVPAVNGIDLDIARGQVFAVLGPNGAGKTTLVRMLATLTRPDAGTAEVFGYDVVREATAVRSLVGLTGQYASVDSDLTARENLVMFARLLGMSRRTAQVKTDELLDRFGLDYAADRAPKNFSGGMRRRLDLAASLVAQPPLLFLDEPTTGLDPRTRVQLWDTVRDLVRDGTTVLLTTQYLEEADQLADRIAVVDRGRLVAEGSAEDLKAESGSATLELGLANPDDSARALLVTRSVLSCDVTITAAGDAVSAPLTDLAVVPDLLHALRAAGIDITGINTRKPSLDDVFFALTGRPDNPTHRQGDAA